MILTFGLNYTFGIFFEPVSAEFGWTRAATSLAYSLSTLVAGFWGIFAGRLSDRFGPRLVMTLGGFLLGLGFLLMSQVNALWQLYLFYGLIIAAGIGGSWPALIPTVAKWFAVRRGLMTGIVVSGIGFGTLAIPPLASGLISIYDWRPAYIIIGIIALVLIILAAQFLKRDPHQIGQLPYGDDAVKHESSISEARGLSFQETIHTRQFWMVCTIYSSFGFGLHTIMVHIVPDAMGTGISAVSAANILATIGGANIIAKIAAGSASDRLGVKSSLVFSFILMLVALLWLQLAEELWMFYLFGVVFGFAYGGIITLQSLLAAELFGLSSLGVILGSVAFAFTIGGAVGPVLSGRIFDIYGSYRLAFLACAILALLGTVLALSLTPLKREKGKHHTP
jgi:MFS family permease